MAKAGPDFSRSGRNRNRKGSSAILNILIGVVVLLIIIVAATIFFGNNDDGKVADSDLITTDGVDNPSEETTSPVNEDEEAVEDEAVVDEPATENTEPEPSDTEQQEPTVEPEPEVNKDNDSADAGSVTYVTPEDEIVAETIIKAWQPIGTTQTGSHSSQYDRASVDWAEKQQALAYATGLSQDSMIFWKIKNGGSPQKSVGIVSSKNKAEKYRVYLEWVDGQGWKPVKMDVLNTLDFEY